MSSTAFAASSDSLASPIKPSSSRSHCTTAPATNTAPSNAKSSRPGGDAAVVDKSLCWERDACSPVCINAKQPVPYVFFTKPERKQACPNSAACWSPAIPAMGISLPNKSPSVTAITPLDGTIRGSIDRGTPNSESIDSSHVHVFRSMSSVREALVRSIT